MASVGRPRGFGSDLPIGSGRAELGGHHIFSHLFQTYFSHESFSLILLLNKTIKLDYL